jgi:hypothetical protein
MCPVKNHFIPNFFHTGFTEYLLLRASRLSAAAGIFLQSARRFVRSAT